MTKEVGGLKSDARAPDLDKRTRAYWILSSVFNGRQVNQTRTPSVQKAIQVCQSILSFTDPLRPLSRMAGNLLDDIICNADGPKDGSQSQSGSGRNPAPTGETPRPAGNA